MHRIGRLQPCRPRWAVAVAGVQRSAHSRYPAFPFAPLTRTFPSWLQPKRLSSLSAYLSCVPSPAMRAPTQGYLVRVRSRVWRPRKPGGRVQGGVWLRAVRPRWLQGDIIGREDGGSGRPPSAALPADVNKKTRSLRKGKQYCM